MPPGAMIPLLLVLLWLLSWVCSLLAGIVAIFACSVTKPKGRRMRRILAVINLVLTASAIAVAVAVDEQASSRVFYIAPWSIIVAAILGVPTLRRQEHVVDESVASES